MKIWLNYKYYNIRRRLSALTFALFFTPMSLIVGLYFFIIYQAKVKSLEVELKFNNNLILTREADFIEKTIEKIIQDLSFLSKENELKTLINEGDFNQKNILNQESKINLIQNYQNFAQENQNYDQIRLIDLQGKEIIKVYKIGNIYLSSFDNQLDNQFKRYWFQEGLKLEQNEIFISPLDLNLKRGKVEVPFKPTIHFLSPIFNKKGQKKVFLVINYLAQDLIDNLNKINTSQGKIFLINEEGFWLKGLNKKDEWGFMFLEGQDRKFEKVFATEWQQILEQKKGNIKTDQGIFSFNQIDLSSQHLSLFNSIYSWPNDNIIIVIWMSPEILKAQVKLLFNHYFLVNLICNLIIGIISGIITFIKGEKKEIQLQLKQSEAKYRQIIETAEEGICIINKEDLITFANPKLATMLGYSLNQIIDQSFFKFVIPNYLNVLKAKFTDCLCGEKNNLELQLNCDNNERIWAIISLSPIFNLRGNYQGILAMITDISHRYQSEKELQQAKQIAEKASQVKSQFISNISHELRTPLNGILGYTQLIKNDSNLNQEQQQALNIINNCGINLLDLINDLLSLSKLDADKIKIEPSELNLIQLLTSLVKITEIKAQNQGLKFNYLPDPYLPIMIYADGKILRQILLNLLSNGIKFTPQGEVTLKIEVLSSRLISNPNSLINVEVNLRFTVQDTGIGIPFNAQKKIFLPFTQLNQNNSLTEGIGLGLTIAQKLVNLLDSEINVESSIGKGSIFWFDLKLCVINWYNDHQIIVNNLEQLAQESLEKIINPNLEQSKMMIPDQEMVKTLYDLAKKGLLDELNQTLEEIQINNSQLTPFCQEIILLIKQFKLKQIRILLNQCLCKNY